MAATRRRSCGRRSSVADWRVAGAYIATALCAAGPAHGAAKFSVEMLPAAVVADGVSAAAVLVSVRDGFPNNLYAVKGTFSDGARPYFGLTYNPGATRWETQQKAWDGAQMQFQTDGDGEWTGYVFVRLERSATLGDLLFRVSGIPLRPIGDPGPTVGAWYPVRALAPADAAWLSGHVYLDPAGTVPAEQVVVRALDDDGRVLGAYLSQNSAVADGRNHADKGHFIVAAAPGVSVAALEGRTRYANAIGPVDSPVALFTRSPAPWPLFSGRVSTTDALWGDADGDNAFTWADVSICARIGAGLDAAMPGTSSADANGDGHVTLADAVEMARVLGSPSPASEPSDGLSTQRTKPWASTPGTAPRIGQ